MAIGAIGEFHTRIEDQHAFPQDVFKTIQEAAEETNRFIFLKDYKDNTYQFINLEVVRQLALQYKK